MASQSNRQNQRKSLPGYVKIIILAQAATILAFTIGMYQEYLSNIYLQAYVINILASNIVADAMLSMVTMSVFALGTFTLLGSMSTSRRANKDWQLLSKTAEEAMDMPSMPVLEVVESAPKKNRTRSRTRRRKPNVDTDELFQSMTSFANPHQDR